MKRTCLATLVVLLSLLAMTALVSAKAVVVDGHGATRDEALRDAFRMAVENAVGALVESQTLVRNAQVVTDEIYTRSQGFIQDYQILREQNDGTGVVVTAQVMVNTDADSVLYSKLQQLKLIDIGLGDPRIGVIMPEYHLSSRIVDPEGESAIVRKLREAGFKRVVDPRQIENIKYNELAQAVIDGNIKEAVGIATSYQLDYVIVGKAVSEYVGNLMGSGVQSCRAHAEAKLLKVDTGEVIAANGFDASGVDITPYMAAKKAARAAGENLGDYMAKQLLNYGADMDKPLKIVIRHIPTFGKLNSLQAELKQVQGVSAVYLRGYNGGVADLDVTYNGAAKTLAGYLENFSTGTISITEISNSSIHAEIIR